MRWIVASTVWVCLACSSGAEPVRTRDVSAALSPSRGYPRVAAGIVVAIGDLHGDLEVARKALRLAGALGADDHWSGGRRVVVQTGDVIDRGDDDRAVIDLLERLRGEAAHAGGAFIPLLGNHEIMNVAGDLRYVTPASAAAFEQGRAQAFAPGSQYARVLARWPVIAQVGESVFVHGGVLPEHARYGPDRLNAQTAAWMRGEAPPPAILMQPDSPVWTRQYSSEHESAACTQLQAALRELGATRMIVGHTPQSGGISSACGDKVWRIDTGMSHFYGGRLQVLAIEGGKPRPWSAP